MRHRWMRHSGRWLALLLLALAPVAVGAVLFATPARADGVTVTLSTANGTNFTYGGTQPSFTVVVTFSTPPTTTNCGQVNIQLDNGQDSAANPQPVRSSDGLTWTYTRIMPSDTILVGQRTAVATFFAPGVSCVPVQSSPFNFTVNKATVDMACRVDPAVGLLVGAGQAVPIQMLLYSGGPLPAEWLSGTYTVTFDGPTHVTSSNLTADSNFFVTVTAPSQIGIYTLSCAFSGSASYTSSTVTYANNPYTVSAMHSLGTVQLFTNPTTLAAGKNLDFYVAFHPASGLPMPTGYFSIWLGNNYTNAITLGSSGTYLIHLSPLSTLAGVSKIEVFYMGDRYYNEAHVYFPLTNPPIPSGTGSGGSGSGSVGNNPQGTATAQGTANATATSAGDETTPTTVGVGRVVPATTTPSSGIGGGVILAVILATLGLLVVAGAGVTIYLLRRRASIAAPGATQLQDGWPGAPTNQWDAPGRGYPPDQRDTRGQGQWDDATQPYQRRDR